MNYEIICANKTGENINSSISEIFVDGLRLDSRTNTIPFKGGC